MSHVPTEGTKRCRRCDEAKPVQEFRRWRMWGDKTREYRRAWCVDCEREYGREWRRKHPGYHAAKARAYRALP